MLDRAEVVGLNVHFKLSERRTTIMIASQFEVAKAVVATALTPTQIVSQCMVLHHNLRNNCVLLQCCKNMLISQFTC